MKHILILLASLLVVGCPQRSYQPAPYVYVPSPPTDDEVHKWCDALEKLTSVANCKKAGSKTLQDGVPSLIGTGTGFVISKGYIVTADHVVDGCSSVSAVLGYDEIEAQTVSRDKNNDLALLRFNSSAKQVAVLRQSDLRMGDSAINFGYPLAGVLSSNPQITAGYVSSLAGFENNSAFFQYSAPTQFGNSGGPVLDNSGNVIGVVSAKLNDSNTQLVNFATKSTILEGFLKANKVPFEKADLGDKLELPDIAEKAETFTVLVGCWE